MPRRKATKNILGLCPWFQIRCPTFESSHDFWFDFETISLSLSYSHRALARCQTASIAENRFNGFPWTHYGPMLNTGHNWTSKTWAGAVG
jgi:hypothetical protein